MKSLFLLATLFITTTSFANQPSSYARPGAPAKQETESNSQLMEPQLGTWPRLQNESSYNLFSFAEFLEWKYSSPSLGYGRDGVGLSNASPAQEVTVVHKGTTYLPDFAYDPGFKLGFGSQFGPDKLFDLVATYQWLYSSPKGSITGSDISTSFLPLNYLTSSTTASNQYSLASLGLNLHFNWVELQSGYTFDPTKYLTLRPYLALQAMFIEGDLRARYEYTLTATSGGATSGTFEIAKTHGHSSSWSIGPRLGIDFTIRPTENFGIYYNGSWTQQATTIRMTSTQTQERPASATKFVIQKGDLTLNRSIGMFILELGPTWDQWFANKKYYLQLRATWSMTSLLGGGNLSFLNNNNANIGVVSEFRGYNLRALFAF